MNLNNHTKQRDAMFKRLSDDFDIFRNGQKIACEKGFFCGKDYPNTIQFIGDIDIKEDDWVTHVPSNQKYFITGTKPITAENTVVDWFAEYITESKYNSQQTTQLSPMSINIGTISGGAIVGSQQNATLNSSSTINELKEIIKQKAPEDQEGARIIMCKSISYMDNNFILLLWIC